MVNVNAIRYSEPPHKRARFTFLWWKIPKHVEVRVAETIKPLRFDYLLNGQLFMETICSVPSHTINDVCTGIRPQFITKVELINFLRIQRQREMRHLPVLGQFH